MTTMDNMSEVSIDELKSMSLVDIASSLPTIEGDKISAEKYRELLAHIVTTKPKEVRFTYKDDGVKQHQALDNIFIRTVAKTLATGVPEDLRTLQRDVFSNQEVRSAIAGEGTNLEKQSRLMSLDLFSSYTAKVLDGTVGMLLESK